MFTFAVCIDRSFMILLIFCEFLNVLNFDKEIYQISVNSLLGVRVSRRWRALLLTLNRVTPPALCVYTQRVYCTRALCFPVSLSNCLRLLVGVRLYSIRSLLFRLDSSSRSAMLNAQRVSVCSRLSVLRVHNSAPCDERSTFSPRIHMHIACCLCLSLSLCTRLGLAAASCRSLIATANGCLSRFDSARAFLHVMQ